MKHRGLHMRVQGRMRRWAGIIFLATAFASATVLSAQGQSPPANQAPPPVRVFEDPAGQTTPVKPVPPQPAVPATTTAPAPPIAHGPVQSIALAKANTATLAARKKSYSLKVTGADWTDTHVVLAPGDRAQFTARGSITMTDGRKVTADGVEKGWKDLLRQFPYQSSPVGALVGRIGSDPAVVPFNIGESKTLDVTVSGELYLRINSSTDLTPDGSYDVTLKLSQQPAATTTAATVPDLTSLISPALFQSIPHRVQDQAGDPGDVVNFAFVGTEAQVQKAFTSAGWVAVDKTTQDAILHGVLATLEHHSYVEVPMSTLYLFGRPQDLSYARADPIAVAAVRHHLRVWQTKETVNGRPLWVGSATHDNGFEKDQRNGSVTHHIDPNVDQERDFIEQSFAAAGALVAAAYVTPANPVLTAMTATGGSFHSDGRIVVMDLR